MRELKVDQISESIAQVCESANIYLNNDVITALQKSLETEDSPSGKDVLKQLLQNAEIAREHKIPICQDTGFSVFFVEWGHDVVLTDGTLEQAINEGVKKGHQEGYLRKSIVKDPLRRENTGDNTPAVIHTELVPGDKVTIYYAPKGGGSENMSSVKMLKPADGLEGVVNFVLKHVSEAGPNPCPPIVVGVGIGGTFDMVARQAKKALLRNLGEPNSDPFYADLENRLLNEINNLGIGPQGFGGRTTALAVHIETYPAHIASLPVAVNLNCHASRHYQITL